MEEEEGGLRLSKRFTDQGGEVDYKSKSGTAWSHNFLNQKPWHPLSYPNQRRKWIAEQEHAQHQRRDEEVSREYAQEQEFFRQSALVSQKEKEKLEIMQAVSFMYVRPPGYNAESAKAAEVAEEVKTEQINPAEGTASSMPQESAPVKEEKKKSRPKDVFGRALPTGEEFEVLKNAPKMDTGVHGRAKPFGVEVRNVKCVRCGNFGHQSGDRECPLKDAIMPNEENRLKRDDPLTAILAHTDVAEPLKWELKQKPGLSPPRGGFDLDDPNQQIVAEDIYDEYGGFLGGVDIPELLSGFPSLKHKKKSKRKSKHKKQLSSSSEDDDDVDGRSKRKELKHKRKKKDDQFPPSPSEDSGSERHIKKSKRKNYPSDNQEFSHNKNHTTSRNRSKRHGNSSPMSEELKPQKQSKRRALKNSFSSDSDDNSDHGLHKSSTSRHRIVRMLGDRSPLLYDDGKRSSRKETKNSHSTDDEELDLGRDKHQTPRHSFARYRPVRSPSPNEDDQRTSRRKENKYSSGDDDQDSNHGLKKQPSSRHKNAGRHRDRSRSPSEDGERKLRRKPSKKSETSENDRWQHDRSYHKQAHSPDSGGSRQHRNQHMRQPRHHR